MSWNITVSGEKRVAKKMAAEQADGAVRGGFMSEAQATMVQAVVDAAPGTHVSGSIGGHNNADSGNMSMSITGTTP